MNGSLKNNGLLTDPIDVINETQRHFQQVTGTVYHFKVVPDDWIPWYNPKDDINPLIYNDLMSAPTEEEWETVLNNLPLTKRQDHPKLLIKCLKIWVYKQKRNFGFSFAAALNNQFCQMHGTLRSFTQFLN